MGPGEAELWGAGLRRGMASRLDPFIDGRILDVSHRAFVADPLGTVRRIYEHFDLPYTGAFHAAATCWVAQPTQRPGGRAHTAEEFGLDDDAIEAHFGAYRRRFADLL